jgi:hypothetical protein
MSLMKKATTQWVQRGLYKAPSLEFPLETLDATYAPGSKRAVEIIKNLELMITR